MTAHRLRIVRADTIAPIIGALGAGFTYSWLAYEVGEPVVGEPGPTTA